VELDVTQGDVVAMLHRSWSAARREVRPDAEPMPPDVFADRLRLPEPQERTRWWGLHDGPDLLAFGELRLEYGSSNRDVAEADVYVAPPARGRGLGRDVLCSVAAGARTDGRQRLLGSCSVGSAGSGFCDAVGATVGLVVRYSRLELARLDAALMTRWALLAAGYSLVGWDGPCPSELLRAYAELKGAQNDAPTDDITLEDERHLPGGVAAVEAVRLERGETWWTLAARHDASEALAGYTVVFHCPWDRSVVWQGWTAVASAHRRQGLARSLKAAMALRLRDERPDVRWVETDNAASNRDMLANQQ
jgi:GNAT superfamily N-acetyltransferase